MWWMIVLGDRSSGGGYKSKDPFVKSYIKQRCRRRYLWLSDLIHNNLSFVNFELNLVKNVMYLLIFISDVSYDFLLMIQLLFKKKNYSTELVANHNANE